MIQKTIKITILLFFLVLNVTPCIYAEEDCGFNGIKARLQRFINAKKYWDQQIYNFNEGVERCKSRISSLYIDMKELRNSEYILTIGESFISPGSVQTNPKDE